MTHRRQSATNFADQKLVQQYGVYPLIHKVVSKPALLKFIGPVKNQRVLDFGCGNGHITFELSKRGAKCVGVDPSEHFIEVARKSYPNIEFKHIHKSRLGHLKANQFDKVILSLVLPNVNTKAEFKLLFKETARVLKKNGELVLSTLHPLMVRNFKDAFREVIIPPSMNYFATGAQYVNTALLVNNSFIRFTNTHWTLEDIADEIVANGLVIVGISEPKLPKRGYQNVLKNALHTPYVICFKARKLA
jgi:ubiquinone/menaquinone biosynthesis C-methylase UbiE